MGVSALCGKLSVNSRFPAGFFPFERKKQLRIGGKSVIIVRIIIDLNMEILPMKEFQRPHRREEGQRRADRFANALVQQ